MTTSFHDSHYRLTQKQQQQRGGLRAPADLYRAQQRADAEVKFSIVEQCIRLCNLVANYEREVIKCPLGFLIKSRQELQALLDQHEGLKAEALAKDPQLADFFQAHPGLIAN